MKSTMTIVSLLAIGLITLTALPVAAQPGVGVGAASIGEDLRKAGGELEELFEKRNEELTYEDLTGGVGVYGMIGYKRNFDKSGFRIAAEGSYVYFQTDQIRIRSLSINDDTTVSASVEVGTSLIPISLGLEYALPTSPLHPYIGIYPSYTLVNRSYLIIEGNLPAGFENASAGENEFGAAAEFGLEFGILNGIGLGLRTRYTIANLFTADEFEESYGILQIGAALWLGDLFDEDEDHGRQPPVHPEGRDGEGN